VVPPFLLPEFFGEKFPHFPFAAQKGGADGLGVHVEKVGDFFITAFFEVIEFE
jgi:hypothetical protein